MAYLPDLSTTDPKKIAQGNRQMITQQGQQLIDQAGAQAGEAGADTNAYLDSTNAIENQAMAGEGGYTADEAAGIKGDPSSYSKYFDPNKMDQTVTDSQGRQDQAVSGLQGNLDAAIDPSQLQQSSGYRARMDDSLGGEGRNIGGAVTNLGKNLNTAVAGESTGLNAAVDPSKLGLQGADKLQLDQGFNDKYLMTPEEQQRMVTGAGISAGLKDREAVDAVNRQAAAAGTDPLGVGAYRARMARQEAADAGDAMTQARIGASNVAAGRVQTSEQMRQADAAKTEAMRLGSEQDISSRQQQNVRDVANQNIAAQENLTATGIGAQETVAQQEQSAATTEEQNRQAAQQYLTGAKMQSATTGGEAALQNTQAETGQTQQQQQFNTGTGTNIAQNQDTAASTRATGIANTRIGQQNTAVADQNQKAGMFNQNQQNAYGRQLNAYGTQTGGANQAAGTAQQASQNPTTFDKVAGAAVGAAGAFLDQGGIVDQPTVATIGEKGPEAVVPLGQNQNVPFWKRMGQSPTGPAGPMPSMAPTMDAAQGMAKANNPYGALATAGAGIASNLIARQRQKQQMGQIQDSLPGALTSYGAQNNTPPPFESPMYRGSVVTKPTVAMLGDKGPEAVVPLNNNPGNKVKPSMLFGRRPYGQAA